MLRSSPVLVLVAGVALALAASACSFVLAGAGVDAEKGDAGDLADGATDAGAPAVRADGGDDLAGGNFCASLDPRPAFCRDFDDARAADAGWTGGRADPRITFGVVASTVSPPGALRVEVAASSDNGVFQGFFEQELRVAASTTLSCSAVVTPRGPTFPRYLFAIAAGAWLLDVKASESNGVLGLAESKVGGGFMEWSSQTSLAQGTARRLRLEVKRGGVSGCASGRAELFADDVSILTACVVPPAFDPALLRVGLSYLAVPHGASSVDLDDVVCRAQ